DVMFGRSALTEGTKSEEGKISLWVCREEKLVSGLTKRTTCADVVRVLLEDQNLQQGASAAMLSGSPQSYCVVEKWRGFERILPNKTKVLRLWGAWGDEQEKVRFVLVKNEASLTCWTAAATAANLSQEKQRRIVRKAFRKLDKMNKKKEQTVSKDKGSAEKMKTLVHLVISQDHTIRQQLQRIKELDREIEQYEAKVHFDRIKRHGVNYVQDTYMVESFSSSSETPAPSDCRRQDLTERERRRGEREADAAKDAGGITEEMRAAVTSAAPAAEPAVESFSEDEFTLEEERIKTQLDTSLYIGLWLKTDMDAIRGDLDLSMALWETRESELLDLLAKVETMEIEHPESSVWANQARSLSKACNTNDDDSDTGLSSMHSQDSRQPARV
uniref:Ras-associating domain-containing protein n=1 Tax=Gasterosteus aculeatus aculeatus TaxID=481459 RepID=A0AAQ4RC73_GASAC